MFLLHLEWQKNGQNEADDGQDILILMVGIFL